MKKRCNHQLMLVKMVMDSCGVTESLLESHVTIAKWWDSGMACWMHDLYDWMRLATRLVPTKQRQIAEYGGVWRRYVRIQSLHLKVPSQTAGWRPIAGKRAF
jgi:hypothetical protein